MKKQDYLDFLKRYKAEHCQSISNLNKEQLKTLAISKGFLNSPSAGRASASLQPKPKQPKPKQPKPEQPKPESEQPTQPKPEPEQPKKLRSTSTGDLTKKLNNIQNKKKEINSMIDKLVEKDADTDKAKLKKLQKQSLDLTRELISVKKQIKEAS